MVAGNAPSCAAPSMPRARPETTVNPASAKALAKSRASLTAAALALRAPTSATQGSLASARRPRQVTIGGALSNSANSAG
jgi:hypothetical protein